MLTALQIRKLTAQFRQLDMDHNGYVERSDFAQFAERLCQALGFAPGSPEYEGMYTQTLASWDEEQLKAFDRDGDNRISLEEHLASYDVSLNDPALFDGLTRQYTAFVLGLWDRDGDGKLTADEYVKVIWCYGVEEEAAREAFRHLDRDGDGYLAVQELEQAVEEFFLSDDPAAPGNWLVGPW